MITIRTLLLVATAKRWSLYQIDVKNVFLHGNLKKTIYIEPPLRYYSPSLNLVCKLRKSLNGIK